MTTKTEAQAKITAAENNSYEALAAWRAAVAKLDGSVGTNGYGILNDPSELELKLLGAKKHIAEALERLAGAIWPTNADYDRSEGSDE